MTRKERVALVSLVASLGLTVAKLTIGLMIGSLALITDALHSGTDAIATLVTFLAVRFADRPADDDHPYGHGKFEDLAALGEGLARLGRMQPLGALDLVDGGPRGEAGGNSAFRLAGVWGRLAVGPQMMEQISLLNGPVINAEGRTDVVGSQQQVDDLLDSLGF